MGFVSKKRGCVVSRPFAGSKGQIDNLWFLIFELLAVLVVALVLFQYINNVATDLGFEKRYTAIDLGMLTTAVYYAPGTLKQTYVPVDFGVPMDFIFGNGLVDIKERGKELDMFYWFLSDRNLEPLGEELKIEDDDANLTYYKAGRQLSFDRKEAHPLQMVCPVLNTTDDAWKSKKIFIAKVLKDKKDYSDPNLPTNRIAQILSARYGNIEVSGTSSTPVTGGAALISAIPAEATIVIAMGDSGEKRESGSLVIYVPADGKLLKARRLACFLLNDLLTSETNVYYAQIMPVYLSDINQTSPLRVFKELSSKTQLAVFIDISTFSSSQVNVDNVAKAIYRALERYHGAYAIAQSSAATFSFVSVGQSGTVSSGTAQTGTGASAAGTAASSGSLQDSLDKTKAVNTAGYTQGGATAP